jgi:hypothetical protein
VSPRRKGEGVAPPAKELPRASAKLIGTGEYLHAHPRAPLTEAMVQGGKYSQAAAHNGPANGVTRERALKAFADSLPPDRRNAIARVDEKSIQLMDRALDRAEATEDAVVGAGVAAKAQEMVRPLLVEAGGTHDNAQVNKRAELEAQRYEAEHSIERVLCVLRGLAYAEESPHVNRHRRRLWALLLRHFAAYKRAMRGLRFYRAWNWDGEHLYHEDHHIRFYPDNRGVLVRRIYGPGIGTYRQEKRWPDGERTQEERARESAEWDGHEGRA